MKRKYKIVYIVEAMLGGIRRHLEDIVGGLDLKQFEIFIIYSENRVDESFRQNVCNLSQRATLIKCNEMEREISIKKDYIAYQVIKRYIKQIKPDIVHCHSSKAGLVGRLAAKRCGVSKIVYTPHAYAFQNPYIKKMKNVYILVERFLSRHATTITINVSEGENQKALENKLDRKEKFICIYNGISDEKILDGKKLRKKEGFEERDILVGVTARCAEQKDPFTFLRIAEGVISKRSGIEFIYIGDGPLEEEMKKWVENKKLGNKIHMLGFRENASMLVNILDIYLSTSLYEGLPYSMIEAMRAGVPIIATDVTGNNELVVNGVNGLLFDIKDIETGVRLIVEQIDKQLIERKNVRQLYHEKYSVETMLNQLTKVYLSGE